jgi:hypothetical protein
VLDVVISQNDKRSIEAGKLLAEQPLAARTRDEVTGDCDEIGLPLRHPLDRPLDGDGSARGQAEVEVREMCDP